MYLHDNTLRGGEQFPGVEFTKGDKIEIGRALSEYGIHRIELMPAVSREDREATLELNSMGLSAEIVGFCRSVKEDIQQSFLFTIYCFIVPWRESIKSERDKKGICHEI